MLYDHVEDKKSRFSLYCLEDGEEYLEDVICDYFPPSDKAKDIKQRMKHKQKGRMRLCSHSIFFEPDDLRFPIVKFSFANISDEYIGASLDLMDVLPNAFSFHCTPVTHLLQYGAPDPYTTVPTEAPDGRKGGASHVLSPSFSRVDRLLEQVNSLIALTHTDALSRSKSIKMMVEQREQDYKFDFSWLEDVRETVQFQQNVYRVVPLVRMRGCLLATDKRLYYQAFNNIEACPVVKLPFNEIKRVAKRRYMMQEVALEIQMNWPRNGVFFFAFNTGEVAERDRMYNALLAQPGMRHVRVNVNDLGKMTGRWERGEISNFDYLMYLNWLGGRSFNDLSQYPVFPWVLKDYTSPTIDLDQPGVYRDLSKPVGALNTRRLEGFKDRMEEMQKSQDVEADEFGRVKRKTIFDKIGNFLKKKDFGSPVRSGAMSVEPPTPSTTGTPRPFLYGTHYSAPGYVVYYLVRQVPHYMLNLQRGKFDAPDRMFDSFPECWVSVITNQIDVKELIPEFFFGDGAFLHNKQNLKLGVKQGHTKVRDDVELPAWAESAADFIRKHREALESEYVSRNLHLWIDLIFGHKQRGAAALAANNVFHPLTYDDYVDWGALGDEGDRGALELQVREFGVCPKQLFNAPHAQRGVGRTDPSRVHIDKFVDVGDDEDDKSDDLNGSFNTPTPASPTLLRQ